VAAVAVARAAPNAALGRQAATATTSFGLDLMRRLSPGANQVFSPYSIVSALAMARVGAAAPTSVQIDRVLHAGSGLDLNGGLNALDQQLMTAPAPVSPDQRGDLPQLSVANSLWGQRGTVFERSFLDILARDYASGVHVVDYKRDPAGARSQINAWVADRTRQRITGLLPDGAIDRRTRLVLANAIYLKAKWEYGFDRSSTRPGRFFVTPKHQVQAQLMTQEPFRVPYLSGAGYQAVELPYRDSTLSMLLVVPSAGRLPAFEHSLTSPALTAIVTHLKDTSIALRLPRFRFTTKTDLAQTLTAMGMPIAFSDAADFSAITHQEKLQITHVIHQADLSTGEQGTEAAAATAVTMIATSAPPPPQVSLTVNRPFLFAIRDKATGLVLFLGRVSDPTSK